VPSSGSACDSEGLYCYFPEDAGCFGATCVCETSGQWSCSKGDFCDAGVEQGD
jgi:hypothetical protein